MQLLLYFILLCEGWFFSFSIFLKVGFFDVVFFVLFVHLGECKTLERDYFI